MQINPCACMGPIGNDPECPCRMRAKGLTPTEIWTPEAKAELDAALTKVFNMRQERKFKFRTFLVIDK